MSTATTRFLAAALALALATASGVALAQKTPSGQKKVYRWVDKSGQVHYGDSIPAEYASQDREVVNRQGIATQRIEGEITPEEARMQAEAQKAQREAAAAKLRDNVLLQSYVSVKDIEQVRDRRVDMLNSQILVQQQYLDSLKQRYAEQQKQSLRYKPWNKDAKAPEAPEHFVSDLKRTESDMRTQEKNLQQKTQERENLRAQFASDIQRFKELKGIKDAPAPAAKR
jgi:hypothetical protein